MLAHTDIDIHHVDNLGWTALLEEIVLSDGGPEHQEIPFRPRTPALNISQSSLPRLGDHRNNRLRVQYLYSGCLDGRRRRNLCADLMVSIRKSGPLKVQRFDTKNGCDGRKV